MDIEEADERLASGWHVDPSELNPQDSPQRRRYLKTVDGYGRPKDQDGQRQSTLREGSRSSNSLFVIHRTDGLRKVVASRGLITQKRHHQAPRD